MMCDIYRSKSKSDWYIIVPTGKQIQSLPSNVLTQLGELVFFKTRDFQPGQPLIGASADIVLTNISARGYHAQGVDIKTEVSEAGAAIGGGVLGASVGGPIGAIFGAVIGYALAEHAKETKDVF